MIHESILGTIGNTPVVRISRLASGYLSTNLFEGINEGSDEIQASPPHPALSPSTGEGGSEPLPWQLYRT